MTGVVQDPVTIAPDLTLAEVRSLMNRFGISGMPVVEGERLVGILTDRDMRFERNPERIVREVMTPLGSLVTCPPETNLDDAKRLMQQHKIEKLRL